MSDINDDISVVMSGRIMELNQQLASAQAEIHELKLNLATHSPCAESFNKLVGKARRYREALEQIIHQHPDGYECRITEIAKAALGEDAG